MIYIYIYIYIYIKETTKEMSYLTQSSHQSILPNDSSSAASSSLPYVEVILEGDKRQQEKELALASDSDIPTSLSLVCPLNLSYEFTPKTRFKLVRLQSRLFPFSPLSKFLSEFLGRFDNTLPLISSSSHLGGGLDKISLK